MPPAVGAQSSNHWTAREVPLLVILKTYTQKTLLRRMARVSDHTPLGPIKELIQKLKINIRWASLVVQ